VFQLSDGTQVVMAGALRGVGDTRWPFVANVMAHYLVGLPVALLLGFALDMRAQGLWWGLVAGLSLVALALLLRFMHLTSRDIVRVDG